MRAILSRRKIHWLVAALCAGAGLQFLTGSVAQLDGGDDSASVPLVSIPTQHVRATATIAPGTAGVLLALAHRTADAAQAGELFAPRSWYTPPPPPPPPPPAPVAAPTAPPLPYAFLGSYTDGSNATVYFVTREDRVYDVRPGDVLDQTYSVGPVENGQLVFIYKPLDVRQSLPIGGAP